MPGCRRGARSEVVSTFNVSPKGGLMVTDGEPPGMTLGYARVSTLEQDESLQHDALTAAGCQRIVIDKASGRLESRPAMDAMLEHLRPSDTVVIWRLDRL